MIRTTNGFGPLIKLGIWLWALLLLQGCGETIRAPVYEEGKMVARSGPPLKYSDYVVKPSDTLYSIAWKTNLDYRTLAAWNGLREPYSLHLGQRLLLVPPEGYVETASYEDASTSAPIETRRDRVRTASSRDNTRSSLTHKMGQLQQRTANGVRDEDVQPRDSRVSVGSVGGTHWRWPTSGRIVRRFSDSDRTRKGIQIGGQEGQAVVAAKAGKVVYRGAGLIGYGNLVIVKHDNTYLSAYGNNRKILVKEGQRVSAGQHIAEMGRDSSGKALLHFEIRQKGQPVNPADILPPHS